ncbi:MAG: type II secretion system minor pseudopilin GspK [Nitrospinae bacterium]|nr:type II secretion system minor pseudopilin GspK [Nitrospinota bacterium]
MAGQEGMAVLLAVMIVAVAAGIGMTLITVSDSMLRRADSSARRAQADAMALPAILWVAGGLPHARGEEDRAEKAFMPVDGGSVKWEIYDMQGRFDLNCVAPGGAAIPANVESFRRLAILAGQDAIIAETLADWLDSDDETRPDGAEDGYYQSLEEPYLAANGVLNDLNDVALVKGFTPRATQALENMICALPRPAAVNVNTATAETLAAVIAGIDIETAERLVQIRGERGFESIDEFKKLLPERAVLPPGGVTLKSDFFGIKIVCRFGDLVAQYSALVEAGTSNRGPKIVWMKAD